MKTTLEFHTRETEVIEGACPNIEPEERTVVLLDECSLCLSDDIPFAEIKRIIFES